MGRIKPVAYIFGIVLLIGGAQVVRAYENKCTHPRMMSNGIRLLQVTSGGKYSELRAKETTLVEWVEKEDEEPNAAVVFHHFFNPRNFKRLEVHGLPEQFGTFQAEDADRRAARFFSQAVSDYRSGAKASAFVKLGRATHLLQDMHQPGHTHNDAHIPPAGPGFTGWLQTIAAAIPGFGGLDGTDKSPLESDVEVDCNHSLGNNVPLGAVVGTSANRFGLPQDESGRALFFSAAERTYLVASFPVNLPTPTLGAEVEVSIYGNPIVARFIARRAFGSACFTGQDHWELLVDGETLPGLCYAPAVRYDGHVGQRFANDWWEALPDGDIPPPLMAQRSIYIEKYDRVETGGGISLNRHFQNTLLAPSVEMTAAYLERFSLEVDQKIPTFLLLKTTGEDRVFSSADVIDEREIKIFIEDPIDSALSPSPSGIYRLFLVNLAFPNTEILPTLPISASGELGEISRTFSGLADGNYQLRAYDGLGNVATLSFGVDATGGPKDVPPTDSDPNNPPGPPAPPTPGLGVEIDANTGEFGQACAGAGASGHKPLCVRTEAGGEQCYPEPQAPLCITWACSLPGTYDIPINFQDDRGNWARTHTIHCHDAPAKITACTAGQSCQEILLPPNFDLTNSTITAVIEEGAPYCGSPQACSIIEQIGGGKCERVGFGGCSAIRWSRLYHNTLVAAAGMFYFPPEDQDYLRNEPFSVHFSLNGGAALATFTYPIHNSRGATVRLPALGQPYKNCANDPLLCIASGGNGAGGGPPSWGDGPPPTPEPNPLPPPPPQPGAPAPTPDPMQQAAASQGRSMLGGSIRIGNAATIFGREMTLTHSVEVPPYQPTAGAEICRWTGTTWSCEGPATAACTGGTCLMTAGLRHASTWAFLAPLPASYPDLTGPNITDLQISENGTAWNPPGALIQTTDPFVRLTARDPPSGVELISGLAVSSSPLPFTSSDPALVLHLHLDEGSGSQLFDSSRYSSTSTINLTPAWVAGRFGSALEFTGTGGQQVTAPVSTRVDLGPFSIQAWVYPTSNSGTIARKGTAFSRFFNFSVQNGKLWASVGDGSISYTVTSAENLPLNQWSLVGMSFDGTKLRIFANGEQKGEVAADYEGSDPAVIIGLGWKGRIDEVRILSRAIGRAEAALDFRRGFAVIATNDNWRTTKLATQHDLGGLSEGQAGPAVLTASGFSLARSTYAVAVELAVADVAGHFASTALQVPVAPADTTPMVFSGAEISSNTSSWYPQGAIAFPGAAAFRVKVQDPVSGDALRSGVATSTQPAPFTPDPHTQLLLHFDEGTGNLTYDSSARATVSTIPSGLVWTEGRFGRALEFGPAYHYILASASPGGLDVPNWTLNVWVYPTVTPTGSIVSKSMDPRYGFSLRGSAGRPQLNVRNSVNGFAGGVTLTAPDLLPLNQWTALTATSDQSFIRLYVNGELKASAPGYMEPNSASFLIGALTSGGNPWQGRLDEIRFMSRPQSPEEVLLDYRRGYAALFSSNGGANWTAPSLSYGPAVPGDLDAVLSASGLTLADSLTSNVLRLFAADAAGNTSSATYVLPAALDAAAPAAPVIVSTQLAPSGAVLVAWEPAPGEVPVSYALYRATEPISSLAGLLPVASTSALYALDAPAPDSGDVVYYALSATSLQGNVSGPSAPAQTFLDRAPPITSLAVQGSSATVSETIYVLPASSLTLSAIDQGAAVSGVAAVTLKVDGVEVVAATAPFQLGEGSHQLSYLATDAVGNVEGEKVSSVVADATAPDSTFSVTGGSARDSLEREIIVAGQEVVLTAQDSLAGVSGMLYRVDSGTWSPVAGPVVLPEGHHVLEFYAVDILGNVEAARSQSFIVALAPTSGVSVVAPTATSFTVAWSSMTDAAGYVVLVSSSPDFSTVDFSTAVETRQVLVEGLRPSTTYFVRVAFFSDSNDGLPVTVAAMTASDLQAPSLALFPPDLSTVTTTSPALSAHYSDTESGVSLATVRLILDGTDVTNQTIVDASSASVILSTPLAQGTHTFAAFAADFSGNEAGSQSIFLVDTLPPITTLLINGLTAGATDLILDSTDSLGFSAADPGAGALETHYSVDGGTETLFTSPFILAAGTHTLVFHSVDRAGNSEAPRAAAILVRNSDVTPPDVRLDFPGSSALGVEQAVGGTVEVRGVVSDEGALTWTLEAAPGASATSGFAAVASGAGNVSGVLASWNTSALSGYQTLRLSAIDAFGNSASAAAEVFVGAPVLTFAVGRKNSDAIVSTLKGPTGIAVRADGAIWVASTQNDKIHLISPEGVLLGEAGHAPGHSGKKKEHGKKDKHDDDEDDEDAGGLSFKTPQGLALDAAGSLYVADRDLNRVVKLSSDGQALLLQFGKMDGRGRPKPGSGPGELRHPFDVAVDGNGDVYVADSGNRRVQVFDASGNYQRQFGQGVLLSTSDIRGIALTDEGLWVSDRESERIYLFSRAGALIKSIGDADSAVGEISRTRGLAADRLGALYVVEPNRDRTQKFDPQGKGLLAFGSKAGLTHADKRAKRYLTQPIDAAVAPDGAIWITDAGRDRIVRYALPTPGYDAAAYSTGGDGGSSSVEPASRIVDHKDGAKVERDDGAGVRVPEGALTADLEITVDKGDENRDKDEKIAKRREIKIEAVSEEVQYGPEGTIFSVPVTLTIPYDAKLVASQGIKEDDLKVYYWNPTLKDWEVMPSTVDKVAKTVNAQTTHFSAYQVGGLGGIGVAAIDDFGLRDGYAFPNPFRNGAAVTFRLQPGSADSIEVRVYDLSGRKVHSSSDFRFRGALDDGNGNGAQNTYDHVWDVSGVGSGVYTFVMTARKAGQPDVRKTGKVGVIR